MSDKTPTCKGCMYFDDTKWKPTEGACLFNPPQLCAEYGTKGIWPRIQPTDRCGQWEPIPTRWIMEPPKGVGMPKGPYR